MKKKSQLLFFFVLTLCCTFVVSRESLSYNIFYGSQDLISRSFNILDGSQDLITSCLQSSPNNSLSDELVFTPLNSSFETIWQARVNNLRFIKPSTPRPSVIVTPLNEMQVQTALFCAKKHGYEMRIRCGGHDFEALSSSSPVPFLMLDLVKFKAIDVDVENKTAWVQGGVLLGELYYTISQKTNTLYFPGGTCPTVGIGGFISGGGYGNLVRKYGTGGDNVLDVRFMNVEGNILDRESMGEDLFWALRGGGASSFGIVLAWKLRLVPVPEIVTVFRVTKTLEQNGTDIFYKYQLVAPLMDRNLLIRVPIMAEIIPNTTQKTVRMAYEGLYLGRIDTLLPLLDDSFPELNVTREDCEEMRMVQSSLVLSDQGPRFNSSTPTETLVNQSAILRWWNYKGKSDYVRKPIPKSGLRKIWDKMFENDETHVFNCYTFGGRMDEISETAIPYPHRAGVLYQVYKNVDFSDQTSDTTPVSLRRLAWIRSFDEVLEPYMSQNPREAYSNYNDLDLGVGSGSYEEASVWGERYWKRDNFKNLIRIKAEVDPDNFFKHPQSIPVFSGSQVNDFFLSKKAYVILYVFFFFFF